MERISLALVCAVLTSLCVSPIVCAAPPKPRISAKQAQTLLRELTSDADTDVTNAESQIRLWLGEGESTPYLWRDWIPALLHSHRYQDAADISWEGVKANPDLAVITPLMEERIEALLDLKKTDEALEAAKSYYNVCEFKRTAIAVDLVARCLEQKYPATDERPSKFRQAQATLSVSFGDGKSSGSDASVALSDVRINDSVFEGLLKTWSDDKLKLANLLLMADRPNDAEALFRELFLAATTKEDLRIATEGTARALRAQDGSVARANLWLSQLQKCALISK